MPVRMMRAGLTCWPSSATEASARASMAGVRRAGSLNVLARIARSSGGRGMSRSTALLQGRPQVGAAAEEADHDQGVERLDEDLVVRVAWIVQLADGGGQQPVGGIDVARRRGAGGTRPRRRPRADRRGLDGRGGPARAGGGRRAGRRSRWSPGRRPRPAGRSAFPWAELGGAQQLGDGADESPRAGWRGRPPAGARRPARRVPRWPPPGARRAVRAGRQSGGELGVGGGAGLVDSSRSPTG